MELFLICLVNSSKVPTLNFDESWETIYYRDPQIKLFPNSFANMSNISCFLSFQRQSYVALWYRTFAKKTTVNLSMSPVDEHLDTTSYLSIEFRLFNTMKYYFQMIKKERVLCGFLCYIFFLNFYHISWI